MGCHNCLLLFKITGCYFRTGPFWWSQTISCEHGAGKGLGPVWRAPRVPAASQRMLAFDSDIPGASLSTDEKSITCGYQHGCLFFFKQVSFFSGKGGGKDEPVCTLLWDIWAKSNTCRPCSSSTCVHKERLVRIQSFLRDDQANEQSPFLLVGMGTGHRTPWQEQKPFRKSA